MNNLDPKEHVIRRYFDELFGRGELALVEELLHPDYVNHSPSPGLPPGRAGVRVVVAALRTAFPDLRYTIDDLVIGSDAVATRTTLRGTNTGSLFGAPPTGRRVEVMQLTIERFAGAQIIAHHRLTDEATLTRQLGR